MQRNGWVLSCGWLPPTGAMAELFIAATLSMPQNRMPDWLLCGRARTLPLGLWLVRVVYLDAGRNPTPLINSRFTTATALRSHLLDELNELRETALRGDIADGHVPAQREQLSSNSCWRPRLAPDCR